MSSRERVTEREVGDKGYFEMQELSVEREQQKSDCHHPASSPGSGTESRFCKKSTQGYFDHTVLTPEAQESW